jgi:hypothetical protein
LTTGPAGVGTGVAGRTLIKQIVFGGLSQNPMAFGRGVEQVDMYILSSGISILEIDDHGLQVISLISGPEQLPTGGLVVYILLLNPVFQGIFISDVFSDFGIGLKLVRVARATLRAPGGFWCPE